MNAYLAEQYSGFIVAMGKYVLVTVSYNNVGGSVQWGGMICLMGNIVSETGMGKQPLLRLIEELCEYEEYTTMCMFVNLSFVVNEWVLLNSIMGKLE